MPIDTQQVIDSNDIVDVISRYIAVEKSGSEHKALCPFHDENNPSFSISRKRNQYWCFGCGAHGDVIKFVMEYRGLGFKDAVAELTNGNPPTTYEVPTKREYNREEEVKDWQPIIPVPDTAPSPPRTFSKKVKGEWLPCDFAGQWVYEDARGIVGYVNRFELNGKKDYIPVSYCTNIHTGEVQWKYQAFTKPRPIFNYADLIAKPDAVIMITEGEKKAQACNRLVPSLAAISWAGGGKAVKHTNFEPVRGRNTLIWRDADEAGVEAAETLARLLVAMDCKVKIIDPPSNVPESWDLWDAERDGWTGDMVKAHIRTHARDPLCVTAPEPELHEYENEPAPMQMVDDPDGPRALGHDHGKFYYLTAKGHQVLELSASAHTKLNLMAMAGASYWKSRFEAKDGFDVDMACEMLMRSCERVGVYDPDRIRGRGAWWDAGRPLLHVGSHLIIDGQTAGLLDPSVEYIYEASKPLRIDVENPLTAKEAYEFVALSDMLQWEKPIYAKLLAGWVLLAPICGALGWRPHIWITGGAGTGKSYVMSQIIGKVLGNNAVKMQGSVTEAGIRQTLAVDALPVLFDEAEGEDQAAQARIQSIMGLARQASSEGEGGIVKGSASGKATIYRTRSMFCLSSIGVGVTQYADKTRFTVLSLHIDERLTKQERQDRFKKLEDKLADILTPEYCARFRARAVSMIPIIRANAKVFATASAKVIGTQRLGDQIGALLAGAYSLHKNGLISPEDARDWVEAQDWSEESTLQDRKDELACLSHILEHTVRVGSIERSVGELINIVYGKSIGDNSVSHDEAHNILVRHGIKVELEGVKFANSHTSLASILKGTLWAKEWGRILKRVEGSEARPNPERFGAGGLHRCVIVPFDAIEGR